MVYKRIVWPILSKFDPEIVHEQTLTALELAQATFAGRLMLQGIAGHLPQTAVSLFGLQFPNAIGMAAGFDKDVRVARGLSYLGFGHVEVGTLTPAPQLGNPKPRIFRLADDAALINRMGFPNGGVEAAIPRLKKLFQRPRSFMLGVSMGKQKETPLAEAVSDYLYVMQQVYRYADYLVIKYQSPNTPGLRDLQGGNYLSHLLKQLRQETAVLAQRYHIKERPLLVKIAPDLSYSELDEILAAALNERIDGIIATNTTLSRENLIAPKKKEMGGLSGQPLAQRSTQMISHIYRETNGRLPIIGVGGIQTAADIQAKLDAGAVLVQLYTALVYGGPSLIGQLLRGIQAGQTRAEK